MRPFGGALASHSLCPEGSGQRQSPASSERPVSKHNSGMHHRNFPRLSFAIDEAMGKDAVDTDQSNVGEVIFIPDKKKNRATCLKAAVGSSSSDG